MQCPDTNGVEEGGVWGGGPCSGDEAPMEGCQQDSAQGRAPPAEAWSGAALPAGLVIAPTNSEPA